MNLGLDPALARDALHGDLDGAEDEGGIQAASVPPGGEQVVG